MLLKIKAGIILDFSINKIEYPVALDNHCPRLSLVLTTKVKIVFLVTNWYRGFILTLWQMIVRDF